MQKRGLKPALMTYSEVIEYHIGVTEQTRSHGY